MKRSRAFRRYSPAKASTPHNIAHRIAISVLLDEKDGAYLLLLTIDYVLSPEDNATTIIRIAHGEH